MKLKPLILLAVAIALYYAGHVLDLRGDAAPFGADGVSPERAKFHFAALVMMLGALGCFIAAGVSLWRGLRR